MEYLPGTANLIGEIDKKQQVSLRDGRILIGMLRSIDQFANLVLTQTYERIHVGKMWGNVPMGTYCIRGENVVLIGEVDTDNENPPASAGYIKVSVEEIKAEHKKLKQEKERLLKVKLAAMRQRGLVENEGNEDGM